MELNESCLKTLTSLGLIATGSALGWLGLPLAVGALEILGKSGELAVDLAHAERDKLAALENKIRKNIEKNYKTWINSSASAGRNPHDIEAALENLSATLQLVRPTFADMEGVRRINDNDNKRRHITLSQRLLERLRKREPQSVYCTSDTAAGIFTAMIEGVSDLARVDDSLHAHFAAVRFDITLFEFDKAAKDRQRLADEAEAANVRRHQEIMDAISREKGIPLEALQPIFEQVGHSVPESNFETAVRTAITELLARANSPAEISNDPEAIRIAIQIARDKLAHLDTEGALDHLSQAEKEEDELLAARASAAAQLPRERAQILNSLYRWEEAITAFERAANLDESDPWDWFEIGDIWTTLGNLQKAKSAYFHGSETAKSSNDLRNQAASHDRIGNVLMAEGNIPEAKKSFQNGLDIAKTLAENDPNNIKRQHDLSVSREKIGNIQRAQGKLQEAHDSFQNSLTIRNTLADNDPSNTVWQRGLSVSYEKIGNIQRAQGKLQEAHDSFQNSLTIRNTLADSDPSNTVWQRDLYVSYDKIGSIQLAQSKLFKAHDSFQRSLTTIMSLAENDPRNSDWQHDLSISHEKIGGVLFAEGNLPEAHESFQNSLTIRKTLADSDPSNTVWRRGLIVSHIKLAECSADPTPHYTEALAIAVALSKAGRLAPADHKLIAELETLLKDAKG